MARDTHFDPEFSPQSSSPAATGWFHDPELLQHSHFLDYSEHDDFTAQASLQGLSSCIQVDAGPFNGRLMVARTGRASICVNDANMTLEKEYNNTTSDFVFVVNLDQPAPIIGDGGLDEIQDTVSILPPGTTGIRLSPPNLTELELRIDRTEFLNGLKETPWLCSWFDRLDKLTRISSPWLAERLRSDIFLALDGALASHNDKQRDAIDRVVNLSVVHAFALQYAVKETLETRPESLVMRQFRSARAALLDNLERLSGDGATTHFEAAGARRATEEAFVKCVRMDPQTYARIVRLHHARRGFRDKQRRHQSVRDIAAEEGFWQWGRFAKYYREHFGETPNETRKRVAR